MAETKAPPSKRDVKYADPEAFQVVEQLPPRASGGGGGASPYEPLLEKVAAKVKAGEIKPGAAVLLARFRVASAAGAAANVLRQRHGRDEKVEGWTFTTRKLEQEAGEAERRTGLFAMFNPKAVVAGAKEEHEKAEAERKRKLADAKKAKTAAKAAAK